MKNILRKIIAVGLIASMGLAFASCSKKESDSEAEAEIKTVQSGKLVMATNAYFPPYEYYEGEKIVGIDAEIAKAVADKLGLELEIQDVEFDSIIAGVQSNKYDIGMAGMTVTEERKNAVNFSTTYATGIQVIIVTEDSPITDLDTLLDNTDYKIGVQQGTTGDLYISGDVGEDNQDRISRFSKGNDAVLALSTGKVDAVIIDNEPAKSFVASTSGLKILEAPYVEEEYAMCINKNNEELLNKINTALKELKDDGTLDAIVEKYIPSEG